MTGKTDFTEDEWNSVLEGPPSAGMIMVMAQRGGTFREETFAIGKAYAEARKQHGASQLLDEIVMAKPEVDHTGFTPTRSSSSMDCSACATPLRCSSARPHRARSRSTGALSSGLRTQSPMPTGREGSPSARPSERPWPDLDEPRKGRRFIAPEGCQARTRRPPSRT